jgi:hypothetical protein
LLHALSHSFSVVHTRLDDVARTQQVYSDFLAPALVRLAAEAQQNELHRQQEQLHQRSEQLQMEQAQWDEEGAPAVQAALVAAANDNQQAQQQFEDLQRSLAELSALVEQLTVLEALHPPPAQASSSLSSSSSNAAAATSLSSLPERALCVVASLLRPAELARLFHLSSSSAFLLDRGFLWRGLCVRTVEQIVTGQRAAQQAATARRRALGGLNDDFQSNNFLTCAAGTALGSPSPTAAASPSLIGSPFASPSPPPPPPQHCHVQISFTQAALQSARPKGSSSNAAAAIASLPKGELFSAALRSLQRAVDPALSDFEDQSLRQSAHQRTVGFLHTARDEARHRLGQTLATQAEEAAQLRAGTERKDALAADIQRVEAELAEQKRLDALHAHTETKQANLRRHLDALVADNLPSEELAAERAAAEAEEKRQAVQDEELAAGIVVLKQQKKVLSKAAKTIAVELEHTKMERAEFEDKLQKLRAQIQTVQV